MERLTGLRKKKIRRIMVVFLAVVICMGMITAIFQVPTKADVTREELAGGVIITSDGSITKAPTKDQINKKVTFYINDEEAQVYYIESGKTLTLTAKNQKNDGVLIAGFQNGSVVTESTVIAAKTYSYSDSINLEKKLQSVTPNEQGEYTLDFTATANQLPHISGESNKVVLVLDLSYSMGFAVSDSADSGYLADSYEETRWVALKNAVASFTEKFLADESGNELAVIGYNECASVAVDFTESKNDVYNFMNSVLTKKQFDDSYYYYDLSENGSKLGTGTNIEAGLASAQSLLGKEVSGASVILMTDGYANHYLDDDGNSVSTSDEERCSYEANLQGKKLTDAGAGVYSIVLMEKNNLTDNVRASMGKGCYQKITKETIKTRTTEYVENNNENRTKYGMKYVSRQDDEYKDYFGTTVKNLFYKKYIKGSTETEVIKETGKEDITNITAQYGERSDKFKEKDVKEIKHDVDNYLSYQEDSGYATGFYTTSNTDELKDYFTALAASMTEIPFETASVTDQLNEHFELVPEQENVTDHGDGRFTVYYQNKISSAPQTVSVKIRLKDEYQSGENNIMGSAFTNEKCVFEGKVDDQTTFTKNFEQMPAAIVLNPADDKYIVDQDEILNGASVLGNDGAVISEGVQSVVRSTKVKTTSEHGTVVINADGTFTYQPEKGYHGNDAFTYDVELIIDETTYTKTVNVNITVQPKYTQTIDYIYEDGSKAIESNVQIVKKGESTKAVKSQELKGYQADQIEVPAMVLMEDATIVVTYKKDSTQTKNITYTIQYYKDGVVVEKDKDVVTTTVWVNAPDTVDVKPINITDKYYGYRYDGAILPTTAKDQDIIEVRYIKDESATENTFYTVKHIVDGKEYKEDTKTYEGKAWVIEQPKMIDIQEHTLDANMYTGYKFAGIKNYDTVPTQVESRTVIELIYEKDNTQQKQLHYTIEYYMGSTKMEQDTETVTESQWINDTNQMLKVLPVDQNKEYTGYQFGFTNPEKLPEKINDGSTIKVYYIKDYYGYTVVHHYGNETLTVPGAQEVEYESVLTKDAYSIQTFTGYRFDHDDIPETGLIVSNVASENVIHVYYVKDESQQHTISYQIAYMITGTQEPVFVDQYEGKTWILESKIAIDQTKINIKDKIRGYKFDAEATGMIPAEVENGATINIYYSKDENQLHTVSYTVEYYKDGVKDAEATKLVQKNVWINDTTIPVNKADINTTDKYTGYKFTGTKPIEIPEMVENQTVLQVYYVKGLYEYRVEYYYNGVMNPDLTDTFTNIPFGTEIINYTDKGIDGYVCTKVDGMQDGIMKISTDSDKNVIRVYYDEKEKKVPEVSADEDEVVKSVATGDTNQTELFMVILIAAGSVLLIAMKKRTALKQNK